MQLAFYRGKSWISKAIRWQTRGEYSHVGIIDDDGTIYEAWHDGGVLKNATISTRHTRGTVVDIFDFARPITDEEKFVIRTFLNSQLGKGYDFLGVLRFITRDDSRRNDKARWFCSEWVMAAFTFAGISLLNVAPWRVSPTVLSWSPMIRKIRSVRTKSF